MVKKKPAKWLRAFIFQHFDLINETHPISNVFFLNVSDRACQKIKQSITEQLEAANNGGDEYTELQVFTLPDVLSEYQSTVEMRIRNLPEMKKFVQEEVKRLKYED
jgi:hypothetical protein